MTEEELLAEGRRLGHLLMAGVNRTMDLRSLPYRDEVAVYRQQIRNQHVAVQLEAIEALLFGWPVKSYFGGTIDHPACA